MKTAIAAVVVSAGLGLAPAALAQDLPRWNLDQACVEDGTAVAFCRAMEANAFSEVSGVWRTLPPDIRKTCLEQIARFGQNSYRLLDDCLEEELTKLRVDFVREASGADQPDPPRAVEIGPGETAQPAAQPAADQPAAEAPKPQ